MQKGRKAYFKKINDFIWDPENIKAERKFNCGLYLVCLEGAALQNRAMPCKVCGHYFSKEYTYTDADIAGSMVLVRVLFDDRYKDLRRYG